jgi:hypothetical protein
MDKQQRMTSYVSSTGLKVYETEQYNADCNDWFLVGDSSTNKKYVETMIDWHNQKLNINKECQKRGIKNYFTI